MGDSTVKFFDLRTGKLKVAVDPRKAALSVATTKPFDPAASMLAVPAGDGTVVVLNGETGDVVCKIGDAIPGASPVVTAICNDRKHAVTGSAYGTIRVWDYHDGRHLRECLALWSAWQAHCEQPAEVALALWFHDAVYAPSFKDNELQSASWAARALGQARVASEVSQQVFDLVMATCHDALPDTPDARILVDIDLAILGSPPARFTAYDRDIRLEYEVVPAARYRAGRPKVLEGFLARPAIYQTPVARNRFEVQACENLQGAIERLSQ